MTERTLLTRILRKVNHHRTTEVYFVGYPKTGNTWMVYMLGRYIQLLCGLPNLPLFDTTDDLGRCKKFCFGPKIQFTHSPLLWDDQRASDLYYAKVILPFESKRVVLLIRHPLDTLVSHWMNRRHRIDEQKRHVWAYTGSIEDFLDDPVWGIEKYFRFYSLWYKHRDRVKDYLLLRYEDTRSDPYGSFARLLQFLDIPRRENEFRQAVADADFENMKKVERSGDVPKFRSSGYSIFGAADRSDPDAFHVRRGKVGGFRDYLTEQEADRLLASIDRQLPEFFGYSSRQSARAG